MLNADPRALGQFAALQPVSREAISNDFELEADLCYELDLFGRVRNSIDSARRPQQASAADLATLSCALHAELATDYFTLRSADAQASSCSITRSPTMRRR